MDREEIVRGDFPTARRGWDPEAVREHLRAIAEAAAQNPSSIAGTAGARVAGIISAAEASATEIVADAKAEAERIAERAREEARERIERAEHAVAGLVGQARRLQDEIEREPATEPDAIPGPPAEPGLDPVGVEREVGDGERDAAGEAPAEPTAAADTAGARLVALKLALEGASAAEISARIEDEFPEVADPAGVAADVIARTGR